MGAGLLAVGLAAVFVALVLLLGTVGVFTTERQEVARGLAAVRAASLGAPAPVVAPPPFAERVVEPLFGRLTALGRRLTTAGFAARLQRRLDVAGHAGSWTVERVLAYKAMGLVGLGAVGALVGSSSGAGRQALFALVAAGGGFWLPDVLLYNTGLKRQQEVQRALPDALDLLTISVEAGLGFDAALAQVARNLRGPLSAECVRVLQEMQIGKTRAQAFRALAARTDVPELATFVTSLVQADAFGVPIADVLREQAAEMRLRRFQRAEEKAQQVPVKILFPLVVFLFPALFIVVIGPAAMSMGRLFSS